MNNYGEYTEENLDVEHHAKAVLSIKYAKLIANHPQNVHILYSVPDGNTLPHPRQPGHDTKYRCCTKGFGSHGV